MFTAFISLRRTARSLSLVTVGVLSTLGALSFTHVGPASAQGPGVNLAQLVAQVNTLQSKLATDETTISSLQSTVKSQGSTITSQGKTITSLQNSLSSVQSNQTTDEGNIGNLQTLTAPLSLSGTDFTFTGVNVHIVDGSGYTDDGTNGEVSGAKLTGLGNLIIGYNATGNNQGSGDIRTGSHTLILGDQNNYSSFGGLVAGQDSRISAPYASVSGGIGNMASGFYASVSGGYFNTASATTASVSGGENNTASGAAASVSGGYENTAGNTAGGQAATVSGGRNLTQNNYYGWSGGSYHTP